MKPLTRVVTGAALAALLPISAGISQLPAVASAPSASAPDSPDDIRTLGDSPAGLSDLDARGVALPRSSQRTAAARLDAIVRWNEYGTPASILPRGGSLGAAPGDAVSGARAWLSSHADVLGLTSDQVAGLAVVNNQPLAQSSAKAVLFEQRFGALAPALGSKVTVGVSGGQVRYVSSSLTRSTGSVDSARLSPTAGWLKAAANVGRADVPAGDITSKVADGWTRLTVPGFAQEQQARLRALALADGTVRPVIEANVVDVQGGAATAYTVQVDAVTGEVLHRQNRVLHSAATEAYNGETTADGCGPKHPFETTDANTKSITVTTAMVNTANDVVIKLLSSSGAVLASGDLLTSPETLTYAPAGGIAQGVYQVQICPFDATGSPLLPPYNYAGTISSSDSESASPELPLPRWRMFAANPTLNWSASHTPTNSVIGCWVRGDGCTLSSGPLEQPFSAPWDVDPRTNLPTFTTMGNNAETHEAWLSPLTPGGTAQAPVSPTREYTQEFTDAWNNSQCDPAQLVPGGNDINAATGNLFVSHNRMHDYSYGLGFTERTYNLQLSNFGRNTDPTRENDPEIGNVQAGALSGGSPSYLGRDNANQIALQDGLPGITNQYLFQPIAGAFYSPCADGSLDMSIVGHEYTHAISNRMIGGPDEGITSEQGGAMGESWGDLVGGEYMFSHGYPTGANPWAVGPYATGNKAVGIRDYAINANPLNYSDYGFDSTGDEVHADGEIWNATMWEVRQELVRKYDAQFRYTNQILQRRCAQGSTSTSPRPASECPGNRRWVQLMFDSFLLQQGNTSMLDARDAMIAADRMRFAGANARELWRAFAHRGMGVNASTPSADSGDVKAGFVSPREQSATLVLGGAGATRMYVGRYEARATPVADTFANTPLGTTVKMAPGRYTLLVASKARGFKRLTVSLAAGQRLALNPQAPVNLAATAGGAKLLGASADSRNAVALFDGTEASNWGGVNADGANVDQRSPWVAVDLAGATRTVTRVQVSSMLRPSDSADSTVPLASAADEDPDSGSRFTALRKFALERCVSGCGTSSATWIRFYTSPADAFPGIAPRPVAPNLVMRSFDVPDVKAAAIRIVALENQCTGYAGYAGEQDNDPTNATDCKADSDRGSIVHAAELQVFGS